MVIKYAHRGLIKNGTISILFEKLYLLIVAACTSLFYSFSFSRKVEEKLIFRICNKEEPEFILIHTPFNSIKTAVMLIAFVSSMTILYSLMYFSAIFLVRKKKISVYGKYQRNVLTLRDTYLLACINQISTYIVFTVAIFSKFSPDSIRFIIIFVGISIILINGYILPLFVLVKLYFNMPEFYSNTQKNVDFVFQNQAPKLIPRPQHSPFSSLPYIPLKKVKCHQEHPTFPNEKKIPKIIISHVY